MPLLKDIRPLWLYLASGMIAVCVVFAAMIAQRSEGAHRPLFGSDDPNLREEPPLPRPQENVVKEFTPEAALVVNAGVPFSREPIERAHAFSGGMGAAGAASRVAALECLAAAVYYEASGEGQAGERAVAQVVLNRVGHPAFPSSVCGVVYQGSERPTGCQFTFTCDGSLARKPTEPGWSTARRIAEEALDGKVDPTVGMATHYHANSVVPYWAGELSKIAAVGSHIFYRWPGYWGRRAAFRQPYTGETTSEREVAFAEILQDEPAQPPEQLTAPSNALPIADLGLLKLPPNQISMPRSAVPLRADENTGTLKIDEAQPLVSNEGQLARSEQSQMPTDHLRLSGRAQSSLGRGHLR